MTYFAALLARHSGDWKGEEVDLDDVSDLDTLTDLMADFAGEDEPALLLLEREDEWFAVVRVDGAAPDARVFVSDVSAAVATTVGAVLLPEVLDDLGREEPVTAFVENGPDTGILDDLGVGEDELVEMCVDGLLPADALSALAAQAGCLDALESLR